MLKIIKTIVQNIYFKNVVLELLKKSQTVGDILLILFTKNITSLVNNIQ